MAVHTGRPAFSTSLMTLDWHVQKLLYCTRRTISQKQWISIGWYSSTDLLDVASQHFGIVWLDVFTSRTYCLFVYSRALAQKLIIRLSRTFRSGKLFEINTQDLLSKFYSESGKLVSEMFDKVLKMAHDEKELICVLIDEIESIATSRQVSTKNGECTDTVRATNQLLTALDRIRNKPNIIVFCTSNLVESIVRLSLRFEEEHH
jgi:hypothetical protein